MNWLRCLSLFAGLALVVSADADGPATQPADTGGEMMQDKSAMAGYGVESYRLVNDKDEIVSVLRNGLTVIVKRIQSPVVAVRGLVGTGGAYEGKWLGGGLSHLLEHLVAGGSCDRRSELENTSLLQEIGNNSNAYTTEDRTAFFVDTTPPHMEQAVDLVTGWMTGAKITTNEYRREYEVVQRELEMGKGQPDWVFDEMLNKNRYHVSPARVPVIGFQEVIQGLSRDDVYSYYKLAYEPHNMIFTVVGNLDPEEMLKAVRKNVSDFPPSRVFSHDIAAEPAVLGPRTLVGTFPKLGQARLSLGFEGVKATSEDMYALDLLAAILGNGGGSILVEELRDNQELVSDISASDDTPAYVTGTFSVDMQLDPDKVAAATKSALEQLEKLKTTPISPERIRRAKTQLRMEHVKSMLTADDIASTIADDQMTAADLHFSERYVDRIAAVTAEQLQAAARKYLYKSRLMTTLLLPSEYVGAAGLPKAEDLLRVQHSTTQPTATTEAASDVRKVELDNGVTLLLKRITTAPLINISMYSLGGMTAENAKNNGIGNLTMEMLLRGNTEHDGRQTTEFFDSIGGTIATSCNTDHWSWSCSCLNKDFDKTVQMYANVVNHPTFPEDELAPVKQRIDAAIASEDADWTAQTIRYFKHVYFAPSDSPYQFTPMGTTENVDKFTTDQLRDWYHSKVLASRRVIAIYGDLDLDHTETIVRKLLGNGAKPAVEPTVVAMPWNGMVGSVPSVDVKDVQVQKTQQALAGIMIGFKSDSVVGDPENYILDVGQTMAGGWGYPTGYLFETLRGKGLVYDVEAQNKTGRNAKTPGVFTVFAGCEPSKVNEVVDQMLLNIGRLQGTAADMQEDWFKRSKLLITTADAMDSETSESQADIAALNELFGLGYDYHKNFAPGINAVTLDQIRRVSAERLHNCVITISTPAPEAIAIKPGLRTYTSFPTVDLTPRGVQHANGVAKP